MRRKRFAHLPISERGHRGRNEDQALVAGCRTNTGAVHDITDRIFVVQRAYRINDLLPQETVSAGWRWERSGWMLVDRISGRVQSMALPAFDPDDSNVSWFRDYAAYCGVSDDGTKKVFTVVVQVGKRKPLLKKALDSDGTDKAPACPTPTWMRAPARVTFEPQSRTEIHLHCRKAMLQVK